MLFALCLPNGQTSLNKSLAQYFLQFLFTKIVIPAQAGIGTLNRAQRAPIKYFLNFLAPIPAFAGMTKVLNFFKINTQLNFYLSQYLYIPPLTLTTNTNH